ncbi:MAG: lamin tail domain-containing protein [Phycisphaerales bacterium]|jgi:hypothetical protein|nr:lamin tail domain-containing protein [Phycisphaerales bacterium]
MNRARLLSLAAACGLAPLASGQVIISELLVNPAGTDVPGEWLELYNYSGATVDLSGWILDDEDSTPVGILPNGTMLDPGEALIVCISGLDPNDPLDPTDPFITAADFYASWGATNAAGQPYQVIVLDQMITLANTGNPTNEVFELYDANLVLIDRANYEDGANPANTGGWPAVIGGRSIYVLPQFLNDVDNDNGLAWALGTDGKDGATTSVDVTVFAPDGINFTVLSEGSQASPGYVEQTFTFVDCNNNGVDDVIDIFTGFSGDCNRDSVPDECEPDCDNNGTPDTCDIAEDPSRDCNLNGVLDTCEILSNPLLDGNNNGILDQCELADTIVITEIMYDPFSATEMEYVEIKNITSGSIDISGYVINDIEGDGPTDPVPNGTILGPGEIAVLCNNAVGDEALARADYEAAWGSVTPGGTPIRFIPLSNWGGRNNNASSVDEILTVINASGVVVDVANYFSPDSNGIPTGGWPTRDGHGSIYLYGNAVGSLDNDNGGDWDLHIEGLDGAWRSNEFTPSNDPNTGNPWTGSLGQDYGSPGFVPAGAPEQPSGEVIITEIAYTGNSDFPGSPLGTGDGIDEYIEIYNTTAGSVDISGWYIQDEDGRTSGFPANTTLAAGEVAVIWGAGDYPSEVPNPTQAFRDAWGCDYQILSVSGWYLGSGYNTIGRLANGPNPGNEILRLMKADGSVSDLVNYDDDGFVWPRDASGLPADDTWSIYLLPGFYDSASNDSGFSWAASLSPFDQARTKTDTAIFNAASPALYFGSPGALEGEQVPNLGDCAPICPVCTADFDNSGGAPNSSDFLAYLNAYANQDPCADLAPTGGDGNWNSSDFLAYLNAYSSGC